mmetsp:Transcript_32119/g.100851  ORF Transcript_32119/g.100851 Transcript_32119/m.100851 type:complete len:301 (+) Transcript_32119:654-1556(+)
MMLCEWTGTCSVAARPAALLSRGTLKAITCAPTLCASCTSDSVTGPTPSRTWGCGFGYCGGRGWVVTGPTLPRASFSSTRVLGKWDNPSRAASSEPNDSALSSAGSSFAPRPFLPRRGAAAARACASARSSRNSTTSLARASDGTTSSSSPARGISRIPLTRTGTAGPASDSCAPSSSSSSRTLPQPCPATTWSPCRRAPRCTSTVLRIPRPLPITDSRTVPSAGPSGAARSSSISACSAMLSRSSSSPTRLVAETGTSGTSPPYSSSTTSSSSNCCDSFATASGPPGRSTLLAATTRGH